MKTKVRSQEKEIDDLKVAQSQKDDLPGVSSHPASADVLLSTPGTQTAAATANAESELGTPCTADCDVSSLGTTWHFQKFGWSLLRNFLYMYILSFLGDHH